MIRCPSCGGPIEKGKVLLCVSCFESVPHKEREATRVLYVRLIRIQKDPRKVAAGMASKVEKLARMAREARGLIQNPTRSNPKEPGLIQIVAAPPRLPSMNLLQ